MSQSPGNFTGKLPKYRSAHFPATKLERPSSLHRRLTAETQKGSDVNTETTRATCPKSCQYTPTEAISLEGLYAEAWRLITDVNPDPGGQLNTCITRFIHATMWELLISEKVQLRDSGGLEWDRGQPRVPRNVTSPSQFNLVKQLVNKAGFNLTAVNHHYWLQGTMLGHWVSWKMFCLD